MAVSQSACARALPLRTGAAGAETFALARGSRNTRQRQAHSRKPGHRHSSGGAALLSPCRLGPVARAGISGIYRLRGRRADYSVEFPFTHAGMENCARARDGKHGGPEARGIHATYGARLRTTVF